MVELWRKPEASRTGDKIKTRRFTTRNFERCWKPRRTKIPRNSLNQKVWLLEVYDNVISDLVKTWNFSHYRNSTLFPTNSPSKKKERKPISVLARNNEAGTLPPASLGKTDSKRQFWRWHKRRNRRQNSHASLQKEGYRTLLNFTIELNKKTSNTEKFTGLWVW